MSPGWSLPTLIHGADGTELPRRIGTLTQVARIDRFTEEEGAARGARRLRMITGGGLEVEVHPDRALDLGHVTYRGVPVSWMAPPGISSPALGEARGTQWLRSFGGGLLATCGLDTFGPPSCSGGTEYPMHGRVGITPATLLEADVSGGELVIRGEVRQSTVFGENLLLRRTLRAQIGSTMFSLEDTVTNEGLETSGHMILYHVNLGWPLLDERAALDIESVKVTPRDDDAAAGVARWRSIEPPQEGYREQVFLHDFRHTPTGRAIIDNPALDLRFTLSFGARTLPSLHQWKMSGTGHYVMGLEPANTNHIQGRRSAEEAAVLPQLQVGESVSYQLNFTFGPSAKEQKP
ncbi:aldose 1-epimerase family protein [Nesterenkonia ebinurensis]|uniref:aldose 1-epimerase family protein n=1 Tax=Nesterenkonia ebinurensis TaxID=2608252 RepID=UPI00123DC303|nr:aldose 1-epimerase family protein [Nesterenkonia ebinurensis]